MSLVSGPPNQLEVVVPDGVARVRVLLTPTPADRHPKRLVGPVHNNVAAFLSDEPADALVTAKMVWLGASGNVVRRVQ